MSISQKIHSGDKIVSLFDNMYVHKLISIKCMYVLLYVNYFILPDFPFFNYSRPYTSSENAVYKDITLSYRVTLFCIVILSIKMYTVVSSWTIQMVHSRSIDS